MSQNQCTCPPTEGLTFDEIITAFNLGGKGGETKNCCEKAGYICPTLDSALRKAINKKYSAYQQKNKTVSESLASPTKRKNRVLRKRKLNVAR